MQRTIVMFRTGVDLLSSVGKYEILGSAPRRGSPTQNLAMQSAYKTVKIMGCYEKGVIGSKWNLSGACRTSSFARFVYRDSGGNW
jgi:hypothetical protein